MPVLATAKTCFDVVIEIGGLPIRVLVDDLDFLRLLEERYAGFVSPPSREARFEFEIDLTAPNLVCADADVSVRRDEGRWYMDRGDFHAEWDASSARGHIRQTANPYSIDAVLRIVHSILLAKEGGFLLHAASAVRNGRAFLFTGVSGAGKTTIASLAPKDATLLTDEISYVRKQEGGYCAFGTPFTGELAKLGENVSAPIAALYLLAKGPRNRIDPVTSAEACRALLSNILFFAEDAELVQLVFQSALRIHQSRAGVPAYIPAGCSNMGDDCMSGKCYVARSSEIAARRLGDEMMIMSAKDSTLFTLNTVATAIWEAADGSTALDEIVKRTICTAYEVEPGVALRDAEALAEELAGHGILLLSNEPFPAAGQGSK